MDVLKPICREQKMNYLKPTYYFDYQDDVIQKIVAEINQNYDSDKEKAIALYNKVRDAWRYNPYNFTFIKEHYKASNIAQQSEGNCVDKSILLIACLRAIKIPARLHLGKVKNHIAVERLTEKFGTNELTPHGMVNANINGKWLKMSPAFNSSLCERLNVEPLAFDGETSSYLQAYNSEGSQFMEYLDDYGHFEDVPLAFMKQNIQEHYPELFHLIDTRKEYSL